MTSDKVLAHAQRILDRAAGPGHFGGEQLERLVGDELRGLVVVDGALVAQGERESDAKTNYFKMFFGIGSGDIHLGRRIQLAFWLQVLMQYGTGIAAVVI